MGRPKKEPEFSLDKMLGEMAAGLSQAAKKPNNLMYKPHRKQMLFHTSEKGGRQYIGGNRSGKTTGGINEDIWWLTQRHPFIKTPEPPIIGRITTVDFKNGVNKIILPNLKQWLAPSDLVNGSWEDSWNGQSHTLTLSNDSELEIMSYEQDLDKFAGVPRHFIHFDEEPPKDIFQECKARLVDYDGRWWMTMTPVEGMTWTFEEIYDPAVAGNNPLIDIIEVHIRDNPHLSEKAITDMLEGFDEEQQNIRGTGKYIAISGLVFKWYDPEKHVVSARKIPDASWTHYISLDAGYNNPTAVLWHAVSSNGIVVTYDEIYVRENTVEQISERIHEKEKYYRERYGIVPFLRIADPAIRQRNQVTGLSIQIEYSNHGVNFALGATKDVNAGLDKMNNYLRLQKWFISENCPNLQREMRMYKRAQYSTAKLREKNNKQEAPQKKDDHACDSARYFFSFLPSLDMEKEAKKPLMDKRQVASMMTPGTTFNPAQPVRIDTNLGNTNHFVRDSYDECVGEW